MASLDAATAMFETQRISVVIPAFNEERHVAKVIAGVPAWVDQIVLVDDGSSDDTLRVAATASTSVKIVRHRENLGVGAAIASGYRAALEGGAVAVAVMAGDGQMDPAELASLVAPVVAGHADYSKGDRTAHPLVRSRMPAWRRLGNAALSRWTGALTGYPVRDAQCGFTVIGAPMLRQLRLASLPSGYGYPNTLLLLLAASGARVVEVPVTPIYGDELSGLTPWRALRTHGRLMLLATWRALRDRKGSSPGPPSCP